MAKRQQEAFSLAKINDPYYWGFKYIGAKGVATVTQVAAK